MACSLKGHCSDVELEDCAEATSIQRENVMSWGKSARGLGVALAWTLLVVAGRTQDAPVPEIKPVPTVDCLVRMSPCELETLYRNATAGTMPVGFYPGKAIWAAGTKCAVPLACLSSLIWQGKDFDPCTQIMTNKNWVPSFKAKVFYGPSWLDGQPSIIMDYAETSKLMKTVRDEVREIAPGLYLGIMYVRRDCGYKFRNYFVLEMKPPGCPCHHVKS